MVQSNNSEKIDSTKWPTDDIPDLIRHKKRFFVSWIIGIHYALITESIFDDAFYPTTSYLIEENPEEGHMAYYIPVKEIYEEYSAQIPEKIVKLVKNNQIFEDSELKDKEEISETNLLERYKGFRCNDLITGKKESLFEETITTISHTIRTTKANKETVEYSINNKSFKKMWLMFSGSYPILGWYEEKDANCNSLYNKCVPIIIPCIIKNINSNSFQIVGLHTFGVNISENNEVKYLEKVNKLKSIDTLHYCILKGNKSISEHYEIVNLINMHAEKAAIASIMGRNMSHNIGSHVLSSYNSGDKQVSVFHSYLQKRMDILARMTGEKPSWGEPMYFVGDILNGFFKQNLLLNHLIADQGGYKETKIEFGVIFPDGKETLFVYDGEEEGWTCEDNDYEDLMVSIPDGEIGIQAFCIFMESMMRNSAKYGENPEEEKKIRITIKINDEKEYYKLIAYDNLSSCDGTLTYDIQGKIMEKLVDDTTGSISTTSLGIAEMREACGFLIHPFAKEYPAHKDEKSKAYPLWAECINKGINNEQENCIDSCNHKYLSYTFNLAKPKMVAIVKDEIDGLPVSAVRYGITKVDKKENLLTNEGAYQFVLFYVNGNKKEDILKFIGMEHHNLPQRLILVDEENKGINSIIPEKRATVCQKDDISINNLLTSNSKEGYENFIISVYETWINKRWLKGNKAKLVFNFHRDGGDAIWERWGINNKGMQKKIDPSKINLLQNQVLLEVWQTNNDNTCEKKFPSTETSNTDRKLLLYDNHRRYINKHEKEGKEIQPYFYQIVGTNNKKIFETLSAPPQNEFGFKYFLLGFVEAALTKVVIIDERIADASCEDRRYNYNHMIELNEVLCYPIFAVGKNGAENEPLTKNLGEKYKKMENSPKDKVKTSCHLLQWDNGVPSFKISKQKPDFIALHNGIAETVIHKLKIKDWEKSLYNLTPSVVITSGRGNIIKEKKLKGLPFIEFSMIKDNTFPSISKYHLVRSLMSTKGSSKSEVKKDE